MSMIQPARSSQTRVIIIIIIIINEFHRNARVVLCATVTPANKAFYRHG